MTTEQSDATGGGSRSTADTTGESEQPATTRPKTPDEGTSTADKPAVPATQQPVKATAVDQPVEPAAAQQPAETAAQEPVKPSAAQSSTAEADASAGKGDSAATDASAAKSENAKKDDPAEADGSAEPGRTDVKGTHGKPARAWWRRWRGGPKRPGTASGPQAGGGQQAGGAVRVDGAETAKPDPWEAFSPAGEPVPTRLGRATRAVGRFLVHEWTLAVVGALVLAVALTWPALRYPLHTLPQDIWDPSLQAWQMAWSGHILLTNPGQLWQANAFYPESWSFAFSDTLLGYAPAGMIGTGPEAAVLRYNIIFVLAHALATIGAYALARQLGAGRIGAAVAGVSYAYAPWLLAQAGHLHVLSNGGIPLALAMLARGHGWSLRYGYRPRRRHEGWAYAGWLVAAWQLSLGFGIGLPFAYFLGGAVLVATVTWFLRRYLVRPVKRPFGARLLVADLVGGALFAAVGVLLAIPYFKVAELHPNAARTLGDIGVYSPPLSGFFTAPGESRVWGGLHEGARAALPWPPEMTLLPGFVLYALAAGGLFFSVWRLRHRLLLLAGVLVSMVLSMGTEFFGGTWTYGPLFEYLPGWNGIRTPGRLMLWATLLLGLLAAGAVTAFCIRVRELAAQRIPSWPGPWLRLATLLPLLLVIAEGLNATPHPVAPPQPAAMRSVEGPLLVLPSSQNHDQPVMLWTTTRFQDVVNGGSGFTPAQLEDVRRVTLSFPDQTSVDYLRTLSVANVVVVRDQLAGTPWEVTVDNPVEQLGITRDDRGDVVIFRL
ncbi:hypothetical protein [Micromonospora yangpuensis]|uniref:Uncharacterized protein n=1 Tax=Micromonospora yangpuensis TaxID=683228 RepID=A0A1C6TWI7_9ACTN|nr:hypothetical protein [Micromonospora yangpuensis]GGM00793.1 hypothetical protein GCM10012279_17980 [Micromonospora yangpuensis]SCL45961.1 hypothetical protein GA0070617_0100 [Micromonospora yangpuensis]